MILDKRTNYKPFEYPEVVKFAKSMNNSFWVHDEINFTADKQDFKTALSSSEQQAIVRSLLAIAQIVSAEVPDYIDYQGRLTDSGSDPYTGSKLIKFKIYGSPSGDDSLWSSAYRAVQINDGLFNVKLGEVVALPEGLFTGDDPRYLGITIDTDAEITPRTQFITVPYAFSSIKADTSDSIT